MAVYHCGCEKRELMASEHRHDFTPCSCNGCFVDGGDDYCRGGWDDKRGISPATFLAEGTLADYLKRMETP